MALLSKGVPLMAGNIDVNLSNMVLIASGIEILA